MAAASSETGPEDTPPEALRQARIRRTVPGEAAEVEAMSEERLIELETRVAHQERLIEELNDVLTDQQSQLTRLEQTAEALKDRLRALGEGGAGASDPEAERPPHY